MEIFFFWVMLSIAVGVFHKNYRNGSFITFFLLSLVISPILGFVFSAVSKPRQREAGN